MANLNRVHLIGNLCRDPEIRYTPGGTAVGDLGLAVNSRVKSGGEWKDEVTFIDVTCWSQSAEYAQKYLAKGASVFVEGRLQLDTWDDKQTGQKRSKLKVVAESVQGLGKPSEKNQGAPAGQREAGAASGFYDGPGMSGVITDDDSDPPSSHPFR